MVINLHRKSATRTRADEFGHVWTYSITGRDFRKAQRCRCLLNGVDVTNRTVYADSRRGIVRMFVHNSESRPFMNETRTGAVTEERRGHVKLLRRKEFASCGV